MQTATAPLQEIYKLLNVNENHGLPSAEAKARLKKYGKNTSYLKRKRSTVAIFISQFASPLIIVLLVVSILSLFTGEVINGLVIIGMLLTNSIVGTIQESKAEKSLEKLAALVSFSVTLLRDNIIVTVPQEELVPGDVVILRTGDIVPADIRLFTAHRLSANEATLTGESLPVDKSVNENEEKSSIPQDIRSTVFMGTSITGGFGRGIVVETGKRTYLGKAVATKDTNPQTNFEKDLKEFSNTILIFVLIFSTVTAGINIFLGRSAITSLLLGITLALGITPEILPIVVTIAMSAGAFALAKKKVIVKRLSSLEDLGNINVLCTDKTGTLTLGKITVLGAFNKEGENYNSLVSIAYLCSAVHPQLLDRMTSNPLDSALAPFLTAQEQAQLNTLPILDSIDFDVESKTMRSLIVLNNQNIQIEKGSTESIIARCNTASDEEKARIKNAVKVYEDEGHRVISLAMKKTEGSAISNELHLDYAGFIVFQDQPRQNIAQDLEALTTLQIETKIITGDSANVTKQIAKKAGLTITDELIISGAQLDEVTADKLSAAILSHSYFVRVTPMHKQLIIETLKQSGKRVAYMGDGINDVGALRSADVGISVENASAVTKDVSDIILLELDLSALGEAVKQGRRTFANTMKFITNTMSSSFGNVITAAIASFFLPFIPLLPTQILLIDSLSDIQHLSFAVDNIDSEQLASPRIWDKRFLKYFILVFGLLSTVFDFVHITVFSVIASTPELFRTLWFIESVMTEMLATFIVRTSKPFYKSKPSKSLLITTIVTILIALIIPLSPIGESMFGFVHLPATFYGIIIIVVILYLLTLEITKQLFYKRFYRVAK